jgi:rod shape-determining protein MreD
MLLKIAPWPPLAAQLAPDWVLLVLIYWSLELPDRYGVVTAWAIGLLIDVLTGRLLGQFALNYAILIYLCIKQQRRLKHFPLLQQGLFILFILFVSQLIVFWTENLGQSTQFQASFILPIITGTFIWPLLHSLITHLRLATRST